MSTEGGRKGTFRAATVMGLVVAVALLGLAASGQACWWSNSPTQTLTQWVAGVGNWFVAANWDAGVPTATGTARVDNNGWPTISTTGAVAGTLQLGYSLTGSGGNLDLEPGGTLVVKSGEYVGLQGYGTVLQNGGANTITGGQLDLGYGVNGNGAYLMETGSLTIYGGEIIGDQGLGAFLQAGGANSVTNGDLVVGSGSLSDGAFALDGGSLVVAGDEIIGGSGLGAFEQTGGSNVINSSCNQNNYNQGGCTWTLTGGNGCGVGQCDNNRNHLGDYCQSFHSTCPSQNGGSTPSFMCGLPSQGGNKGSAYNCGNQKQGGDDQFLKCVDRHHGGNFSQFLNCSNQGQSSGKSNNCGGWGQWGGGQSWGCQNQSSCGGLTLGQVQESEGNYFLGGGVLTVNGNEVVGDDGFGFFRQTNGQNSITGNFIIGENSLGNGAFFLQGGTVTVAQNTFIGGVGQNQDSFNQNQCYGQTWNQCGSYQWGCGQTYNCGYQNQCGGQSQNLGGIGFYNQNGGSFTDSGTVYLGGNQQGSVCLMYLQGGSGALQISSAAVNIDLLSGGFTLGPAASLMVGSGGGVDIIGGNFVNNSTNETALADLGNLTLYFDGGTSSTLEVSGSNLGAVATGFTGNFTLGSLTIGSTSPARVKLVDNVNNGNRGNHNAAEALYVQNVTVAAGSTLNLNGLKLYYHGTLSNQGTITGGTPILVP